MSWIIKIDDLAKKQLKKLDRQSEKKILEYLYQRLAKVINPKQLGKPLTGDLKGLWRYRVDKFRIICHIKDEKLTVLVLKIGERDKIYDD